ncbi:hypothetical protein K1X76_07395 [bacterium]|nr:hypothetical protein [bacterium]
MGDVTPVSPYPGSDQTRQADDFSINSCDESLFINALGKDSFICIEGTRFNCVRVQVQALALLDGGAHVAHLVPQLVQNALMYPNKNEYTYALAALLYPTADKLFVESAQTQIQGGFNRLKEGNPETVIAVLSNLPGGDVALWNLFTHPDHVPLKAKVDLFDYFLRVNDQHLREEDKKLFYTLTDSTKTPQERIAALQKIPFDFSTHYGQKNYLLLLWLAYNGTTKGDFPPSIQQAIAPYLTSFQAPSLFNPEMVFAFGAPNLYRDRLAESMSLEAIFSRIRSYQLSSN